MKRFFALMVALLMILGALLVRGVIDGEGLPGKSGGEKRKDRAELKLLCATEMEDVCSRVAKESGVQVSYQNPGKTVDDLVASKTRPDFDAWLMVGPWDQVLIDNLEFAPPPRKQSPLAKPTGPLGRSPAVLVTMDDASKQKVTEACPDGEAISCASTVPNLSIGIASPDRGDGLVVLSEAVANRLKVSDFTGADLDDPGLGYWISSLAKVSKNAKLFKRNPLAVALTTKGRFNAVGGLEAEAADLLERDADQTIFYPEPMAVADVRLVTPTGSDPAGTLKQIGSDTIKKALRAEGWRVEGDPPTNLPKAPLIPGDDGLPEPGVLQVLRNVWEGKG